MKVAVYPGIDGNPSIERCPPCAVGLKQIP